MMFYRMGDMFKNCEKFNQPLNDWDVYDATCMSRMFYGCKSFNQPLNDWDVSNVGNMGGGMSGMFEGCIEFNQPLNNWKVSNVGNMSNMFKNCVKFDQPLNEWNANNIIIMDDMFEGCNIKQEHKPDISSRQVLYLKYKDLSQEEKDENKTCPITTDDFDDDTDIVKNNIGTIFNKEAFKTWSKSNNTCPMCRSRFTL